ncbi:MAG TPA: HAMP domain-containing sensor histidine kinase [Luteimonas sp.]|jgi:signal transduction histidine kinase|nr:HAMP domain-containing sensor histidine kinase [Luteimonas sp.]
MLLADLGHEVRTPMTGVMGMSELLLDGALQPQQRRQVEAIRHAGEHLLRLLDQVLDLAQLGEGALRLDLRPFDVRALVDGVAALHAPPARARGLAFRVAVAAGVPRLLVGDALRVRQVLLNLAGNAVKFTRHGEVAIEVSPGEGGMGLRLEVRDTGPGFGDAERARLFGRFARGDEGALRGGSGLGLSICRELVLAMGGRIAAEGAPGAGARFVVELPLPAAAPGAGP